MDSQSQGVGGRGHEVYYTRREAARYLKLSERMVDKLTHDGRLTSIKVGRSVRYSAADLDGFMASCRRVAPVA